MSCSEVMSHEKGHLLLLCNCLLIYGALRSMSSRLKEAELYSPDFLSSIKLQQLLENTHGGRALSGGWGIIISNEQVHRKEELLS